MDDDEPNSPKAQFAKAIIERTKAARQGIKYDQPRMAAAMGITVAIYNKWEKRSAIPLHLIEQFCAITGTDPCWLVFGKPQRRSMPLIRMKDLEG